MPSVSALSTAMPAVRPIAHRQPTRPQPRPTTPPDPPPLDPKPGPIQPMNVRQAIDWYLGSIQLAETTRACYRLALSTTYAPVLGEKLAVLTAARAEDLRHILEQRVKSRTAKPYSEGTIILYWSISRKFSRWLLKLQWIPLDPLAKVRGGAR